MMLKRIEYCCYDIGSAVLICSNLEVSWYCLTQACLPCESCSDMAYKCKYLKGLTIAFL